MKKISERIYHVGVNDSAKTLFEGLWPLPCGVSYNSYVVADEKVALIDTVEHGFEAVQPVAPKHMTDNIIYLRYLLISIRN